MVQYRYRCESDGVFDVSQPMGTAEARARCPECDSASGRVYAVPMLSVGSSGYLAALDHAEKSRDQPDVVSALPPRRGGPRTPLAPPNPALRRLPKP
jgi:predicted nucleic acid-binding Zn ribbon protein